MAICFVFVKLNTAGIPSRPIIKMTADFVFMDISKGNRG
jgi:hypothetical protein